MGKGELTRQRIIEEAAPIFNQRGYSGCSMNDVMEATGLEKGGVYRHFASKEELAAEAFRYALGQSVRLRTSGLEKIESPIARLRFYIKQFVEAPSALPGGCPLMNTAVESDDGNPLLRKLVREGFADWRKRLEKMVSEGIERGEIRKETMPRRVANTIISALEGSLMLSRLEGSKAALKDAQEMLETMLDGISV